MRRPRFISAAFAGLALCTSALFTTSASASIGTSAIFSSGAQECVAAFTVNLRAPVVFAKCNPNDPTQAWAFNPTGAFHLVGTDLYIVAHTWGTDLGTAAQATDFTYVNHQLAGDGYWLTQKAGDDEPFLAADGSPDSQAFYVFTSVGK